jgi:hypothetical protein
MRRSSGDMALALIQSVIFGVDSADGWARFANTDDGSLRGQLRVRARNNSQLGGDQTANFSLEADESGLLLQVSFGEAIANYMVAGMIDAQEAMMEEQQKNAEEMQRKQTEALKEAARNVRSPPLPKPAAKSRRRRYCLASPEA